MFKSFLTEEVMNTILTIIAAVLASSGFWAYIMKRNESKSAATKLLLGLAHDRICYQATKFIDLGSITQDEYESLCEYLYKPYLELGGNGTAKRLMAEVDKLRINTTPQKRRSTGELKEKPDNA